ncbi:hypothetical protein [Anabaena sp. 4-3]|uniref:hypothetical protein n=1 Tax=Anabaena sp. 4-3 TaxID=1811979 RepID=UPI00082E0338|nr:hypothetical protein [Anabaena sp. 4-3]
MTTISDFEALADIADCRILQRYKSQIHAWVYITQDELRLGEVVNAFYHGNLEIVEAWTEAEQIKFYQQLEDVPNPYWMVVLIHPFYIMKPRN